MFYCAFYEKDITPPLGSIIPGNFSARYNNEVLDRIYVRAAVIGSGESSPDNLAAIAVIDACGITLDITDRIRERVASSIPIEKNAIMVTATHTHGGGPTLNWGEEVVRGEEYITSLVNASADAIICAFSRLKPSRLSGGSSNVKGLGFIRIFKMKNGSYKTNPGVGNENIDEPYTEPDDELTVLAAFTAGKPVGAIVNFACHPAIVAKSATSADYIGALSAAMKRRYGDDFITLFINGACGNINHVNPFDRNTVLPGRHVHIGETLAAATADIVNNTTNDLSGDVTFGVVETALGVRRPTAEALEAARKHVIEIGDAYPQTAPGGKGYNDIFFAMQAFQRMLDKRTSITAHIQAIKIGSHYIAGIPAQIFTEYGLRVKESLGNKGIMVSAFANDYLGYCPVPETMVDGVYEARLAATSMLAPDSGDRICDMTVELCKGI